jgi:hypothetical protein
MFIAKLRRRRQGETYFVEIFSVVGVVMVVVETVAAAALAVASLLFISTLTSEGLLVDIMTREFIF